MMQDTFDMNRRGMLQNMALLLGVAALPAEALAAPARKAKTYLAPGTYRLLSAVADTFIPRSDSVGALDAKVPARLDALLSRWASAETRGKVISALDRINALSLAQNKKAFAALTPAERAALLRPHDAASLKKVPPPPGAPTTNFFSAVTYVADPGYVKLKDLVITLYYYSEQANGKELEYHHMPGKFQPSLKLTSTSRPALGPGGPI